jgi:peptide/nickel transport system substrate-binding protein
MKAILNKFLILIMIFGVTTTLISCGSEGNQTDDGVYYNNQTDPLVFSSQEVDKVFNPFFSTTATDGTVVGMTQIGMLGNDKDGKKPTYGDDEAVVTKDLQIVTEGTEDVDQTTTYYFVLKNNVRFSNGSYLTIKDVLFNLYVYLDPAYSGSSTIYSTDIVGLKKYRTQQTTEKEQDSFKAQFELEADTRIETLIATSLEIKDEHDTYTSDEFKEYLAEYQEFGGVYSNLVKDYEKAVELFRKELETDYSNSIDSYEDIVFKDKNGKIYKNLFTTDVEAFLYNEQFISWNKKEGKLTCDFVNDLSLLKNWTKEQAINTIMETKIPDALDEILTYWNTSITLDDYITNSVMEEYFKDASKRKYTNIEGIKFANYTEAVEVNGVTYDVPRYTDASRNQLVEDSYEVLSITINDVDPKAIWNFSFSVAPMYYYSDQEHIEKFDYENNFGVEYSSQSFMNDVVKATDKLGVPVGAGAYAASRASGGITNISAGDFYDLGVIYYEANPYFVMGEAKIKKVRFQVIAANQMLTVLENGQVDYIEPNADPITISKLDAMKDKGIENTSIKTSGYGYIGINAGKVPSMQVRQAIMHAINTKECVDYYQTTAEAIYRPMSTASWAYPKGCTAYYPYIGSAIPEDLSVVNPFYRNYVTKLGKKAGDFLSEAEQQKFLKDLVEAAGYELNEDNIYQQGQNILKYTFTVAGEETDHPAWQALFHASEILNKVGFDINVTTDANALKKLNDGSLTVWAAAWGSSLDPDMYQVYHIESSATSTLNWGYKQIKANVGGKYDEELKIITQLSDIIERARKTNDQNRRTELYSQALDLVMQLAVELPTYQRDDLFAYNGSKIDVNTLTPTSELTPYNGLISDMHKISLKEK